MLPFVHRQDVHHVVDGHTIASTDRSLLVVRVDPAFLRLTDGNPIGFVDLIADLLLNRPRSILLETSVVDAAQSRLTASDVALIAAQFAPGATTVDELVAPYLRILGDVTLAYPAEVATDETGPPQVLARLPSAVTGDGAAKTGFTAFGFDPSGSREYLMPILARTIPSTDRRTVVPAAALLTGVKDAGGDERIAIAGHGHVGFNGVNIPVEASFGLRVQYSRRLLPGGSQVIAASDLASGSIDPKILAGRTVLVGVDAPEAPRIRVPVGGGSLAPIFVNANAVNTLRTGDFLTPAPSSIQLVVGISAAIVTALLWAAAPWGVALIGSAVAALAWYWLVFTQLDHGRLFGLSFVIGPISSVVLLAVAWQLVTIVRHRRLVTQLFSRYVPGRVAEQLMEGNLAEELAAGRRNTITALFVDLRGFTPLAATLDPSQIRHLLDLYYEFVTSRVMAEDGTVMQFVGDEVYAVFGAPLERGDHREAALRTAAAMQADRSELIGTLASQGLPAIRFGIGLHSGLAVAAHVGSSTRRQYAVIGDTVNVASRCCSAADADQIVATSATTAGVAPDGFKALGRYRLKGVPEPIALFRCGSGPIRLTRE